MARSRAIDIRLERLVPAMEEYYVKGIFTKNELRDIAKQRTNDEYKLVARPLLYVDVRKAIDFELELESRIAKYLMGAETQIKNRSAIVERIAHIYDIAIPSICKGGVHTTRQQQLERDALESQYLIFLKEFNRTQELSKYLAAELQRAPSNVNAWVFSVDWELSKGNIDNARTIAQEALKHCSSISPKVWTSLMTVETTFASHLAKGILEVDKTTKKEGTASKKNNNKNEDAAAAASNNNESQQQQQPLSQRYFKVNPSLSKIIINGELIKGACTAALQSQTGGVALLADVRDSLMLLSVSTDETNVDHRKQQQQQQNPNGGEMCGEFVAKFLYAACAKKQLDEQQKEDEEEQGTKQNNSTNNKSTTTSSSTLAVATRQQRSLNLAVSALLHLIQAPFDYFFFGGVAHTPTGTPASKKMQAILRNHQYWNTANYLDEAPPVCPLKIRKSEDAAAPSAAPSCDEALAAQTLRKIVSFSKASTHPLVVKTALQLAESLLKKKLITKQLVSDIISSSGNNTNNNNSNKKQQKQDDFTCCPACQNAFDDCVREFDSLQQRLQAGIDKQQQQANSSSASSSTRQFYQVSNELHIDKWISEEFKTILETELNINIVLSLAPKIFEQHNSSNGAADNNKNNNNNSTSSSSFAALDQRTRSLLSTNSALSIKTAQDKKTAEVLLQDLNAWFDREFGKLNKHTSSSSDMASTLFGSEAISHQISTMFLGRALLTMVMTTATNKTTSSSSSLPARRGRQEGDDSSNDDSDSDDETNNKKKNHNNNSSPFRGFFEIMQLFKLTQPKTHTQIEIRAHAVAIIASVWIEAVILTTSNNNNNNNTSSASGSSSNKITFPFIVKKDLPQLLASTSSRTSSSSLILLHQQLRAALTACSSVLPAALDFLVHIAASIEYQIAASAMMSINNNKKTSNNTNNNNTNNAQHSTVNMNKEFNNTATIKMRQYFETAISSKPKERIAWATWKKFETNLGNLKQAGEIQRRASQALNDSRLL